MSSVNTDKLIAGLKAYFETPEMVALVEEIFHGPFKINKVARVVALVGEAVKIVETLAADIADVGSGSVTGKEKKDAVVGYLDGVLELPFFLEPLDGPIIGIVVDAIVVWFNVKFSHAWIDKVKGWF